MTQGCLSNSCPGTLPHTRVLEQVPPCPSPPPVLQALKRAPDLQAQSQAGFGACWSAIVLTNAAYHPHLQTGAPEQAHLHVCTVSQAEAELQPDKTCVVVQRKPHGCTSTLQEAETA